MEANSTVNEIPEPNASSLRWKILRRALLPRHSSSPEMVLNRVSRKASRGFNLIPYHVMDDPSEEKTDTSTSKNQLGSSRNDCFCYKLPIHHNSPNILLYQRVDADGANLNDFEVCNRHNIDNTGLVCKFPHSYYVLYSFLIRRRITLMSV